MKKFHQPRRILELALEADPVKAYAETGMTLERVIQQALFVADTDTSLELADLTQRMLAKRDRMRARRSAEALRDPGGRRPRQGGTMQGKSYINLGE